jgi:signal transduction histidine kinase
VVEHLEPSSIVVPPGDGSLTTLSPATAGVTVVNPREPHREIEGSPGVRALDAGATMRAMTTTRARVATFVLAYALILAMGQLILRLTPFELHRSVSLDNLWLDVLIEAVWILAIVVLMVRQPTSQLWKIVLLWVFVQQIWTFGYLAIEPHVLIELPAFLLGELWAAVFVHLILAYPSGRLVHRFDRRLVATVYAIAIGFKVVALIVGPEECWPICDNPIRLLPSETLWDIVRFTGLGLVVVLFGAALYELMRHWRAAGPGGRRALWPMVVAAPIFCAFAFAGYFADALLDETAQDATHSINIIGLVQSLLIPVAIIVGAVQARLARGNVADLAVELSHGVPVGGLQPVLARALRDPSLQIAFPAPTGDGFVDADGRPAPPAAPGRATTRLERDGEVLALLIHDPAIEIEDPGLVEAVGAVARMALENERLAAQVRAQLEQVRASRERIVEAADAERRRVERDLHDGAQQRLVALAMRLDLARQTTGASDALLDEATAELRTAVGEVRDLARGLHPTILTEAGLGPAIEALAERTSVPVTVEAPARRFPATIEAAAYFVVAEALTNVARYAGASSVKVDIRAQGETLSVAVRDDGQGGADPERGSGLRGLTDRVAALGGQLAIDSPPEGGTTVRADLPLPA